jgi:hypothetical protein
MSGRQLGFGYGRDGCGTQLPSPLAHPFLLHYRLS